MTHYDEHILELFALHASEVAKQRKKIEAHLTKCAGCRTIVEQYITLYAEAESNKRNFTTKVSSETAIVRKHSALPQQQFENDIEYYRTEIPVPTVRQSIVRFAKQHPIASGAFSFSAVIVLALLTNLSIKVFAKDTNPTDIIANKTLSRYEVINKEGDVLWTMITDNVHIDDPNGIKTNLKLAIADLDGDGKNEVITTEEFSGFREKRALRVFDGTKKLLMEIPAEIREFTFGTKRYNSPCNPSDFVIFDSDNDGKKEIFVTLNNGRSPMIIQRVNYNGTVFGEYWHYGQLIPISFDINKNGLPELVLFGFNDVDDDKKLPTTEIITLNASKVKGKIEAQMTHGFGLPVSDAELNAVLIPRDEVANVFEKNINIERLNNTTDKEVVFIGLLRNTKAEPVADYFYVFSPEMKIKQVYYGSTGLGTYNRLVKEGKIRNQPVERYFEQYAEQIRYWDGKEWNLERVITASK